LAIKLLLATSSPGKVEEYRSLLRDLPLELVTPAAVGIRTDVAETGSTFAENARIKALTLAKESGLPSLADDSGLEVDALNGEPGVRSARYAGDNATDSERINYLLARISGVPAEKRTARFRCVIAIAMPDGKCEICSGACEGLISFESKGNQGFGYDPVFLFPEFGKTMAELPMVLKNKISHRGKAAGQVPVVLHKLGVI